MSNMKATDKQAMEILKKLDELIASSVDLEANIDESESIEDGMIYVYTQDFTQSRTASGGADTASS